MNSEGRSFDHNSRAPVVAIILCVGLLTLLVSGLAIVSCGTKPEVVIYKPAERLKLPQSCSHLYNVGRSDEWYECMGVGKK